MKTIFWTGFAVEANAKRSGTNGTAISYNEFKRFLGVTN